VDQFPISSATRVVRGQHFMLFPFFRGFTPDKSGECRIDLDVRILRPDGKTYHEQEGIEAVRQVADPGNVLLPVDLIGVFFEPEDPLGTYRVEVVARDRVKKVTAKDRATIELVQYEEGEGFADVDAVWAWAWKYQQDPEPFRAAPALRALAAQGIDEIGTTHGALAELFERNQWLFPQLFAGLAQETEPTRDLLLWILARTSVEPDGYVSALDGRERAVWERCAAVPNPIEDPLTGREDIAELMGRYSLARARLPLLRLVSALDPESEVIADITLHDSAHDVDLPLARVVPRFLEGQLPRYLDGTTRAYLEPLRDDERVSAAARDRLARILAGKTDGNR
jgi:hypothetical protein